MAGAIPARPEERFKKYYILLHNIMYMSLIAINLIVLQIIDMIRDK